MKRKIIILTAIAATLLYSCSDRDEDARKEAIEKVRNSNPKLKLNQRPGGINREVEESIQSDTIRASTSGAASPDLNIDPVDGGDPKDVPPRK